MVPLLRLYTLCTGSVSETTAVANRGGALVRVVRRLAALALALAATLTGSASAQKLGGAPTCPPTYTDLNCLATSPTCTGGTFGSGPLCSGAPLDCGGLSCPAVEECHTRRLDDCEPGKAGVQSISLPRFNTNLGVLNRISLRLKVRPSVIAYLFENRGTPAVTDPNPTNSDYRADIGIDVQWPAPFSTQAALCTSPLVGVGQSGLSCLPWKVYGLFPSTIPAYDGCTDYGFTNCSLAGFGFCDPPGCMAQAGQTACQTQSDSGLPTNCTNCTNGLDPLVPVGSFPGSIGTLGGVRCKCGLGIGGAGFQSGFADVRTFDDSEFYTVEYCLSLPTGDATLDTTLRNMFSASGGGSVSFPISIFSSTDSVNFVVFSKVLQRHIVRATVEATVAYRYCRELPTADPDEGDVCRTNGSSDIINVLINDLPPTGGALNCALLTGSNGISGVDPCAMAEWVTDAGCTDPTNPLCTPYKCIRYTVLNAGSCPATDTFTYTITGTNGCATTGTVTVDISSPTAGPDPGNVCCSSGSSTTINVLLNDSSTRPLNCSLLTGSNGISGVDSFATATWVTDAGCTDPTNPLCTPYKCIRYTLTSVPATCPTTDTFTYTITDENGCTAQGTVTVTISSPTANPDPANMCCSSSGNTVINVLLNDDDGARTLNCALLTGSNGINGVDSYATAVWETVAGCTDSTDPLCSPYKCIRYTINSAPPNCPIIDTFTYTITDTAGCTSIGTVTVTISSPSTLPDPGQVCCSVTSTTIVNVLNNDSSGLRSLACGSLSGSAGISGVEPFASAVWVTDGTCTEPLCSPDKCIRYTINSPPTSCPMTDTFTYTIADTFGCQATGTVTITITAPQCVSDCGDVCREVGATDTINVLFNDTSTVPLDCGFLTGSNGITGVGSFATATWVTDGACTDPTSPLCTPYKCIRYTLTSLPPAGVNSDTFSYTIRDQNGCQSSCDVVVSFCSVIADEETATVCQGETQAICVLEGDTSNCGRLGCENLSIPVQPANGQAIVSSNCAGSDGCDPTGAACSCCILYTPNPGFVGEEVFTYRLSVNAFGCDSTSLGCTTTGTVRVLVKPAPVAHDDLIEAGEDGGPITFDVRENDLPGTGCELVGCGAPCEFVGCPVITSPLTPNVGTLDLDPNTCLFTYTPPATGLVPDFLTFCYRIENNCGCCAEACVTISNCPRYNHRLPGSLLLWPEYDNRSPLRTMLTVTNTSCGAGGQSARVEFVYINKTNCLETNYNVTLTPCDSITLYTSAQTGSNSRGYVYAFVKDLQNKPISFNHLTGIAWVTDPVTTDMYGFNALSIRSPLPQGTRTDLDLDNIRDFDGFEYDMLPGEILIPRFLGQDPPGVGAVHQSDLVLLALSGGRAFTTSVYALIYNDSEDALSAQFSFYCWEKKSLLQWSGAFENDFLMSVGDDPEEIYGMTDRVGGWIRLDGLTASSSAEHIVDPVIYALLIERASVYDAAALPWELCGQGNGDLLPMGIFGDGPDFVPGDNE